MGYYKFRFSDMMPNVWFYKLKDMSRTRNRKKQNPVTTCPAPSKATTTKQTHHFYPRKSYYFTRELINTESIDPHFQDPPRKSSKQQLRKMNPRKSFPEFRSDCFLTTELSELKLKLPPIKTKVKEENLSVVKEKKNVNGSSVRKFSVNSPGVRLRVNSPRIRIQAAVYGRKSLSSRSSLSSSSSSSFSGSFAVVKSSFDPQRDFMESMMEMIKENNIRASKDLEDLLACYLTLNSDEYHDVIIKVFKQIWFDLSHVRMK